MRPYVRIIAVALFFVATPAGAEMAVHFIDVGQGGGVLIAKDGKHILYDCGDTFAGRSVIDYLEALDVKTIDIMVISHAHRDHMGGCIDVLKQKDVKVRRIYHNGSRAKTGIWKQFLKVAQRAGSVEVVEQDVRDSGVHILAAYVSHGQRYAKEADNSLLLQLVDGSVRVLLTGDCEATCEKQVSGVTDVSADVLNIGHHGSNAASSPGFLKKVKPKIAVIQAGACNQYGHPTKPVLDRLKQVGATIYRTDQDGSVVVHSDGQTYKI